MSARSLGRGRVTSCDRIAMTALAALVVYFVVTGAGRLPELGWETVVVSACLALVLVPWSGPAAVRRPSR